MKSNRFHIANGRLVKTSNGQPIPEEEPVFILRGRDALAYATLCHYESLAAGNDVGVEFLAELDELIDVFQAYARSHSKIPNITRGK